MFICQEKNEKPEYPDVSKVLNIGKIITDYFRM